MLNCKFNAGLVQKSSVLEELVSKHDVICLQEHLLSQLSFGLSDTSDKVTYHGSPAKQNSADDRTSGGLMTYANSTLLLPLVESYD